MGTVMCIECAYNPVCRVHIKSEAHRVQSIVHDSHEVVPTVGFLSCLLAWLVVRVVSVLLLQQCWGRKRLVL